MKGRCTTLLLALSLAACSSEAPGGSAPATGGDPNGIQSAAGTQSAPPAAGATAAAGTVAPPPAGTGASGTTAASGTGGASGASGAGGAPDGSPVDQPVAGLPIPPQCQGIDFTNIRYSPGGTALPNKCEPFHATLNNPYAVRCVDAWPWYETGYPGDEFCILPPPPDQGIQYGFHPQGDGDAWFEQSAAADLSGYQGLAGTPWELGAGMETNLNYIGGTDNPEGHNFYRTYVRMRVGSHHMINSVGGETRGVWERGSAGGLAAGQASLPSVQRPDENRPNSLEKPAEDAGLYRVYPETPNITFNVHHFNGTDRPILRESWTNIWWEDDARIPIHFISDVPVTQIALLDLAPNASANLHYAYSISEPVRVLELFGHRHAWTPNFTAWVEHPGGETEILYQSFDWFDMPTYRYDSQTQNPAPSPEQKTSGAHSGILTLNAGDKLHFNCRITFTDARASAVGAPTPAEVGNLRFANEAYTAEMCILFGWSAAVEVKGPADEFAAPPGFATVE